MIGLEIGGTVNHGDHSGVRATYLDLGSAGPGVYHLTNGLVTVGTGYVTNGGVFNQLGDYSWGDQFIIAQGGQYNLYAGAFGGNAILQGGVFHQTGGLFNAGLSMNGTYVLDGGVCTNPGIAIPPVSHQVGIFVQTGGTNLPGNVSHWGFRCCYRHGSGFAGAGYYTLSNGVLNTAGNALLSDYGQMLQYGGSFNVSGAINITGEDVYFNTIASGGFGLYDGSFSAGSLNINYAGGAWQYGGVARIGQITINTYRGGYTLSGGMLINNQAGLTSGLETTFTQNGGTNLISNSLVLSTVSPEQNVYSYLLNGGTLSVPEIQITNGSVFRHNGGLLLNNNRLTLAFGTWQASTNTTQFGQLQLNRVPNGTNSTVSLPSGSSVLRFADSHSFNWDDPRPLND